MFFINQSIFCPPTNTLFLLFICYINYFWPLFTQYAIFYLGLNYWCHNQYTAILPIDGGSITGSKLVSIMWYVQASLKMLFLQCRVIHEKPPAATSSFYSFCTCSYICIILWFSLQSCVYLIQDREYPIRNNSVTNTASLLLEATSTPGVYFGHSNHTWHQWTYLLLEQRFSVWTWHNIPARISQLPS